MLGQGSTRAALPGILHASRNPPKFTFLQHTVYCKESSEYTLTIQFMELQLYVQPKGNKLESGKSD